MSLVCQPPPQSPSPLQTVSLETDGRIAIACFGPLEAEDRHALARQADLLAPAKLALSRDGDYELRAEVLRVDGSDGLDGVDGRGGVDGADASKLAVDALDVARAWLMGEAVPPRGAPVPAEDLAGALAELPPAWAWETAEDGGFRVHATAFGENVRLSVHAVAGSARVMARSILATPDPDAGPALLRFALETNRRLRLARIGLAAPNGESTAVTWDAVTPSGIELSSVLPATVEAVVRAHASTRRSLRALCHVAIARLYLDAREAAPRRRRHVPCA